MKKYIILYTTLLCVGCTHTAFEKQNKSFLSNLEDWVLSENIIGNVYCVRIVNSEKIEEYQIAYIGNIKNKTGGNLNFIYSSLYSGLYEDSKRKNSIIVIYKNGKRIGQYYVGGGFNKIPIIINDELVISYNDNDCNQETRLNFSDSIPKQIFINCKNKNGQIFGDIYSFEEDQI